MTKKGIRTKWIERDDGLTDDEIKERIKTMGRKVAMAKKKRSAKKSVDVEKLKGLLEKGDLNAEQLMQELGGVKRLALKNAVLKVILETGKVYEVEGLYGRSAGNIKFGKLGIRIPAKRLSKAFTEGDMFSLQVEGDTIVLRKI